MGIDAATGLSRFTIGSLDEKPVNGRAVKAMLNTYCPFPGNSLAIIGESCGAVRLYPDHTHGGVAEALSMGGGMTSGRERREAVRAVRHQPRWAVTF